MLEMANGTLPVLEIVTVWVELDVPEAMEPNAREDKERLAEGREPRGMSITGPHPEIHATIRISVVVKINLEKWLSCMIRLPRC
jgi:hypothetical protein